MEDIGGGLHPAVDGQSLDKDEDPMDEYTRPQVIVPRGRGRVYWSSTVVRISLLLIRFKVLFDSLYPHIRFR